MLSPTPAPHLPEAYRDPVERAVSATGLHSVSSRFFDRGGVLYGQFNMRNGNSTRATCEQAAPGFYLPSTRRLVGRVVPLGSAKGVRGTIEGRCTYLDNVFTFFGTILR